MKLKKFKEKNNKKMGITLFTIVCIFLVSGVVLYRTFAIFEVKTHQNAIKGTIQDPGNIYFAFYVDDKIEKMMPQKNEGYIFDEENSYCGVLGNKDSTILLDFDKDKWNVTVSGLKESRTKCNLKFIRGAYILGKPVKAVTNGDGLYEVPHGGEVSGTLNDNDFQQTEWRYAGSNPHNYITFNDEKWRIIGLVNVMIGENNTVEQRVKIVRDDNIGEYSWDYGHIPVENDWTKATLMQMLNGIYYNSQKGNCYQGDSSPNACDFSQVNSEVKGLNETAKNMIAEDIIWNIGGITGYDAVTVSMFYEQERGMTVYNAVPRSAIWPTKDDQDTKAKIGLMYPSDYGYATNGGALGREKCFDQALYNWDIENYQTQCAGNDWLRPTNGYGWLLSPLSTNYDFSFFVSSTGRVNGYFDRVFFSYDVWPTLYLSKSVKIVNDKNDGSEEKPYTLSM